MTVFVPRVLELDESVRRAAFIFQLNLDDLSVFEEQIFNLTRTDVRR
jgi:hypothetical protein